MRALVIALLLASSLPATAKKPPKATKPAPKPAAEQAEQTLPLCSGDYADALPAEKAASIFEAVKEPFVFAIRNTATYEHVYYGRDGKLRRASPRLVVPGTPLSFPGVHRETQLATNEHLANQPDGTVGRPPGVGVPNRLTK